jgi:GT2 family glycosyltransferase
MSYNKFDFTFLIVNYNGESTKVLKKCLLSIRKLKIKKYQIIICDNGSTDNSLSLIKNFRFKNIKLILNKKNIGPSAARSNAQKFIEGLITIIMDNDTYLYKINFKKLKKIYLKEKKLAIVQPLIIIDKTNLVDYFGDHITSIGFLQQNYPQLNKIGPHIKNNFILSAKSACMFIRSKVLKKIGFDKDYFIYVEETDLGWKCWLNGYYNIALKEFKVKHGFGSTSIFLKKNKTIFNSSFYGSRNYLMLLYSNLQVVNLIKIFPVHLSAWLGYIIYCFFLRFEFKQSLYFCLGILSFFLNIKKMGIEKRKKSFNIRLKRDSEIFPFIKKSLNIAETIKKITRRPKVGNFKI